MKNLLPLLLVTLIYSGVAGQNPIASNQEEQANIYFFRLPDFNGSAVKMTIMSNNQPVVRLKNASYFKYSVMPGDYVLSIAFGSDSKVNLRAEAGKNYYIKAYLNTGFWAGIPILEPVDPESGKMILQGNRLALQLPEPVSTRKRDSRLGLMMTAGAGFEKLAWFIDEDNNEVTLSTGGGFGIGAEYGRRLGKNFDLSFTALFQGSSLSEPLKNASASFNRFNLLVTPALIIPVRNDNMNFRLGAGPGLYTMGTMKVDGSEIDGNKFTFKYKTAAGFHAVLLFEWRITEKGSMNMGLRYSGVRYEFKPQGSSHQVYDQKLLNPNGSGIDFIMGYSFYF
jgi:hypothetical protein